MYCIWLYKRYVYIYIYTFTNLNDVGIGFVDLYSTSLDERTFKIHWTCREHLVEPQGVKPLRGARGFDFSDFFNFEPISWCCLGEWSGWDGNLVCVPVFSYCPPKKNAFSKWSPCSYWTIDYRVEGGKKNKGIRFMSICEVLFSGHVRFVRSTSDFERSWLERSLDLWLLQAFGRHDL